MLFFDAVLLYIRDGISALGVLVITAGALSSLYQFYMRWKATGAPNANIINTIRLQFGNSVILVLEFMVGADIIGSLVEPDYYNLGLLCILVIIRTVLSYFLNKELRDLVPAGHGD